MQLNQSLQPPCMIMLHTRQRSVSAAWQGRLPEIGCHRSGQRHSSVYVDAHFRTHCRLCACCARVMLLCLVTTACIPVGGHLMAADSWTPWKPCYTIEMSFSHAVPGKHSSQPLYCQIEKHATAAQHASHPDI